MQNRCGWEITIWGFRDNLRMICQQLDEAIFPDEYALKLVCWPFSTAVWTFIFLKVFYSFSLFAHTHLGWRGVARSVNITVVMSRSFLN